MNAHRRQSAGKANACLDAQVRARIQQSQDRAKMVLEASKLALDAQSKQLGPKPRDAPDRLDIAELLSHQSYTLPSSTSDGSDHRVRRKSMSPRPSFDPVNDDMQSTRKAIEPEKDADDENTLVEEHSRRTRGQRSSITVREMVNRPAERPVAANLNGTVNAKDLSVSDILAGSRSERVRRMSQAKGTQSHFLQVPGKPSASSTRNTTNKTQAAAIAQFEQDENNFIAEIPEGFQAQSPPTCQTPGRKREHFQYSDACRIPIQLDDFGGEGYLLKNDFSFNQMCNKQSNRTDSICIPLEHPNGLNQPPHDSFFTQQNNLVADAFKDMENTMGLSMGASKRESSPPKLRGGNLDGGNLEGGNLDGAVCLDCSKKCVCGDHQAQEQRSRSPKRDCALAEKRRMEGLLKKKQPQPSCEAECRITMDPCKRDGLRIECVEKPPEAHKGCDRQLSYLDRMMKSLDLGCETTQKKAAADSCVHEVHAVPARKAKPQMRNTDCCGNAEPRGDPGCCNNNNSDVLKTLSLCSQQAGSNRDREQCADLKRTASAMSSNMSEYNFVSGYLPLKSTHNEISWPSVKLRKSVTKSFQIKNTSPKRLIIRVILDGPGFNFQNAEANANGTLTLQPNEVRTLMLIFNPTVLGPAVGNLIFQPPIEYCAAGGGCVTLSNINSPVTKRVIRLYGYGGHVSMSFERLQQGPVGTKFLPLGNLCNLNKVFEETFIVRNKGNLTGFAAVMLENKTVGKSMFDHAIKICPDKVLVPPNSSVRVKVSFEPNSSDMREMLKIHRGTEVIAIGNILIVTGDEPTRCRMKRLIKNSAVLAEKYSSQQLMNIWADFGRHDCDYDLSELRETGLAVADLMGSFQSKEVALTVNNSTTDMSLIDASGWMSEAEDSEALFHTICQPGESSDCCVVPEDGDARMLPLAQCERANTEDPCNPDEWHVTPGSLTFNTNSVLPQVLTIHSRTSRNRMFEVDSNVANYFCVSPQEGVITPACDTTNISVRMMNYNLPECPLFVYIYIDDDRICVPVSVERGPPEGKATCPSITCEKVANLA